MKKSAFYAALTLLLTLVAFSASATHLVGGSLQYEHLGQNPDGTYRYRIYTVSYTDVGPTSNFPSPEAFIPIAIYRNDANAPDANKVIETQFDLPLIEFERIELEGVPDGCTVGENIEVDRGFYEAFVNLPLNFGGYWLYYDRCCRNDAVVNLPPQQGVGFSTFIPSPLVVNSSPFFNADPVPFLCVNDTTSFLNSAIDPDGDLLVFSFIAPFSGFSTAANPNPGAGGGYANTLPWEVPSVNYETGFSPAQPFGSSGYAFINGATGLTSYMAPNPGQYAIAVEIKEYRNGILIGVLRRDIQLVVINCPPNPAPDLSNQSAGNDGPTTWSINEGDTLCFPVIFTDVNGDSLQLSSAGEVFDNSLVLPTATINTPQLGEGEVQADFCWFTDCNQGRDVPYFFQVTATDRGCPPKSASEVYTVNVVPFAGSTTMLGEPTPCAQSIQSYSTDFFDDGSYLWTVSGGTIVDGQGTQTVDIEWGNAGVGSISVIASNFRGCMGDPFDIEVAIQPAPSVDAGADLALCLGDTITVGGAPTGPNGSTFNWGSQSTIVDNSVPNAQVFPTDDTTYEVEVTSAIGCVARDSVSVTVNLAQLSTGDDQEICEGEGTLINASGAVTYTWSPATGLDDPNSATPLASPLTTTTYTVASIDANSCSTEQDVLVTVFEEPIALAGLDDDACGLETILAADPGNGVGQWIPQAGVTFTPPAAPNAAVTVNSPGAYNFVWQMSTGDGRCVATDNVTLTFTAQPLADAGLDGATCGLVYTLEAASSIGASIWDLPAGISIDNINNGVGTITAADFGVYTLTWNEDNLGCTDSDEVIITFVEQPLADAGLGGPICGDEFTLAANASAGQGTWTAATGTSFNDINNPQAIATTSTFGPQTFTWTEDNGNGCVSTDSVDIDFTAQPVAQAGADDAICGLETSLAGVASVGTGSWTSPIEVSLADNSMTNSLATATDFGAYTLVWTETNGACTDTDEVVITFVETPTADAGMDDAICGDSFALNATASVGTGSWTGAGVLDFADASDPNSAVTSTAFGPQTITWTEDNGSGCTDDATVVITFNEIPVADAGINIAVCGLEAELGAVPTVGDGTWTVPAGLTIDDLAAPEALLSNDNPAVFTLTWTEDNAGCIDSDDVEVEFLTVPVANAGADMDLCIGSSTALDASGGDTYMWSPDLALSATDIADPITNPIEDQTYSLEVALDNGCTDTDDVSITVLALPIVEAGEDVPYLCFGDSVFLQATPGYAAYDWSPQNFLSDPTIADPVLGPAPVGTPLIVSDYTVTVTDVNGCENSDVINLSIDPVVPTDAGLDTLICAGSPVVLGAEIVAPPGSTYSWSNVDEPDNTEMNPMVSPTVTTTYRVTASNSICIGADSVTVMVEETPNVDFAIDADPACEALEVRFTNLSEDGLSYLWDFGDGTESRDESPAHDYAFSASYTITLTATSELACDYVAEQILDATDFASYFDINTPNVMTPNGDGKNDVLSVNIAGNIEDCLEMSVFNRWGQRVFEASGNNTTWDGFTPAGEPVRAGVYFYFLEFNGFTYKGSIDVIY